jgi:hypothetical protein
VSDSSDVLAEQFVAISHLTPSVRCSMVLTMGLVMMSNTLHYPDTEPPCGDTVLASMGMPLV